MQSHKKVPDKDKLFICLPTKNDVLISFLPSSQKGIKEISRNTQAHFTMFWHQSMSWIPWQCCPVLFSVWTKYISCPLFHTVIALFGTPSSSEAHSPVVTDKSLSHTHFPSSYSSCFTTDPDIIGRRMEMPSILMYKFTSP